MILRRTCLAGLVGTVLWVAFGCGVGGSGQPVPPPPSDFTAGATIPDWILELPSGGRGELTSRSGVSAGRREVVLSRPLVSQPRDLWFSLALSDNGTAHVGVPMLRFTADPTASPSSDTVVSRGVPSGTVTPDGVIATGEWDPSSFTTLQATPQNDPGPGLYPNPGNVPVSMASSWDAEYIHFVITWPDASNTRSDFGPSLQWDGNAWVRRPHRANDQDGNGLIQGGETQAFLAPAEDEDRLMLFFPVEDEAQSFAPGSIGCAASCHDPTGSGHVGQAGRNLVDVWEWRAAATAPARRAQDLVLRADMSLSSDEGLPPFTPALTGPPTQMFALPPVSGFAPLIREALDFASGTAAGSTVLPPVSPNGAPYSFQNFNGSGLPPDAWLGVPPFFQNDFLPAYVIRQATESAADIEAESSYSNGQWIVELRRRRTTRDGAGHPRRDDIAFDEDAAFSRLFAQDLSLSLSVVDGGVSETRFPGPIRVTTLSAAATPGSPSVLYVHDYGSGFSPTGSGDFTHPAFTLPPASDGPGVGLRLRAGTDGGARLFIAASWDDTTPEDTTRWGFDGFFWTRGGGDDELRVLWNPSDPPGPSAPPTTCATLCHGSGRFGFAESEINRTADLWHWRAGRAAHGFADDLSVDWRPGLTATGAATRPDSGAGPFRINRDARNDLPAFMDAQDPGVSAFFLGLGLPGTPDAVPFTDVLAGLPPGGGAPAPSVSFAADVLPIFQTSCTECHPSSGGLDLSSHAGLIAGGQSGPAIVPGDPVASLLVQRITGQVLPQMPLGGTPLSQPQIDLITQWIEQGGPDN